MPVIGFVGDAPVSIPYADFEALKTGGSALAPVAEAAEEAAVGSLLADAALAIGAFGVGYFIGDAILKALHRPETMPVATPIYQINNPAGVEVKGHTNFRDGTTTNWDNVFFHPTLLPLIDYPGGGSQFRVYAYDETTHEKIGYYQNNPPIPVQWWILDSVTTLGGLPQAYKTVPYIAPTREPAPLTFPTTIPFPGIDPNFPITPTVVPNPGNDPDEKDGQTEPGIAVKIPELGIQFTFSPTTVKIGRYNDPDTAPYAPPKIPYPPNAPTKAGDPCPCPETDLTEVINRLKKLADCKRCDSYVYESNVGISGNSGTKQSISDELVDVTVEMVQSPSNVKNQYGGGGAPDVFYWGWFAFMKDDHQLERIPLQYVRQRFIPPKSANGFCFTAYQGGIGTSEYTTRRFVVPPDV